MEIQYVGRAQQIYLELLLVCLLKKKSSISELVTDNSSCDRSKFQE